MPPPPLAGPAPPVPPAAPPAPAAGPADVAGDRFVLCDVAWETYEQLADAPGNAHLRFTYDAVTGDLEVEMPPGFRHETVSFRLGLLVTAYARERGIRVRGCGAVTLRRRRRGGTQGDESFYVSSVDDRPPPTTGILYTARGHRPPDLVVEVDVTSPGVSKLPIYRRLGVKEVWVWTDDAIVCRRLGEDGKYAVTAESGELPGFPLAFAAELIRDHPTADDAALQDLLVERLRAGG